jgi:hypothetical protein
MKKPIKIILIIILLLVAIFCFYKYFTTKLDGVADVKKNINIVEKIIEEEKDNIPIIESIIEPSGVQYSQEEIEKQILFQKNLLLSNKILDKLNEENHTNAVSAYLDLGEGSVQELVAFHPDENYYDRKNIRGEYDRKGTVFLFHENESFGDQYLNLFGHGLLNGMRFGYLVQNEPKQLKHATLYTRQGLFQYELVLLIDLTADWYNGIPTWTKEGLIDFVEKAYLYGKIVYDIENNYDEGDYMFLSTCLVKGGARKRIALYRKIDY